MGTCQASAYILSAFGTCDKSCHHLCVFISSMSSCAGNELVINTTLTPSVGSAAFGCSVALDNAASTALVSAQGTVLEQAVYVFSQGHHTSESASSIQYFFCCIIFCCRLHTIASQFMLCTKQFRELCERSNVCVV